MRQKEKVIEKIYVKGLEELHFRWNHHGAAQRIFIFSFPRPSLLSVLISVCMFLYCNLIVFLSKLHHTSVPLGLHLLLSFDLLISLCVRMVVIDWAKPSHMVRGCLYHTLTYPESHWAHRSFIAWKKWRKNPAPDIVLIYRVIVVCVYSIMKVCFMKWTHFLNLSTKTFHHKVKFLCSL